MVTNVERGMRWPLVARKTNALISDGEVVWRHGFPDAQLRIGGPRLRRIPE
jgi:hypothetical protein